MHHARITPRMFVLGSLLIVIFLMAAIYGHALHYGFINLDDNMLIYENDLIKAITPKTIYGIFTTFDPELYIPVTYFSYQLDYLIAGLSPWMFHLTNLLFHTANALLLISLMQLLLKNRWIALALGLIFAVHPLHSEAVLWASARKDVLSTFFFLATLVTYVLSTKKKDPRLLIASLELYLFGLLSKVLIAVLPVILILIDWQQGRRIDRASLKEKIPYVGLSLVFGIIGLIGKEGVNAASSATDKILMAAKSSVFYLEKLFVPTHLSLLYPYNDPIGITSSDFFVPVLILIALGLITLWSLKYTRTLAFGLLFFFLTLVPSFINITKGDTTYFASDRYAYIPSIGILFLIGSLMATLINRAPAQLRRIRMMLMAGASIGVICIFSLLTFGQSLIWQSPRILYTHALSLYPETPIALVNRGSVEIMDGDLEAARIDLERALELRPKSSVAVADLALVYILLGDYKKAESFYRYGLQFEPYSAVFHYGLGNVFAKTGRETDAKAAFKNAYTIDPDLVTFYMSQVHEIEKRSLKRP